MWPIDEILKGNQNAGSRLIRGLEDRDPQAFEALQTLFPHSGKAFIIGITGAPGVGKSTLINCLISHLRQMDKKVGVLAVDPTSPFSGGAILGDRLLMQSHSTDENVFIRSMASRGSLGGLSRAVKDAAVILDAMGFDIIIIETVGAGQSEIDVSIMAHTVGIVTIPGTSDGIQAVKAGIMETGHVLIVNKADMLEADESVQRLKMVLEMQKPINSSWKPAIVKTSAKEDTGIADLCDAIFSHFEHMEKTGEMEPRKKEMAHRYFTSILRDVTMDKVMNAIEDTKAFKNALKKIQSREENPYQAAEKLTQKIINL